MSRYNSGQPVGSINQLEHTARSKASKRINVLSVPDSVIANAATSAQLVKKGSLLRVLGTAGGWIHFGASNVATPDVNSQDAIQTVAEWFFVVATDDYVRTSAAMRIEVNSED